MAFSPVQSKAGFREAKPDIGLLDSVRQEIVNGNRFIIHKLEPKETYYQLSRTYNVPVKDIMDANNKKNLRIGDVVRIPRGKASITVATTVPTVATTPIQQSERSVTQSKAPQRIFTEYKVGKSETLYAISRRFDISVETIKKTNDLASDRLREGQILKIPEANLPESEPIEAIAQTPPVITEERQPLDLSDFEANKYGIREKKERGIGVWMDSLGDGESLALHKTAPIGTILKITNPMNKSVTFAKVVGKFADNQNTQDAIVVISKSVATTIVLLDRRFQIELTYGAPL
ncbi:MAG TPA: LysM peptidoglycan-binding domain-containing protein [Sphingobacterium sp.]|nr:LysM peptidoglycan-binding domain-containing protein [Sphingobacterium sp.]